MKNTYIVTSWINGTKSDKVFNSISAGMALIAAKEAAERITKTNYTIGEVRRVTNK